MRWDTGRGEGMLFLVMKATVRDDIIEYIPEIQTRNSNITEVKSDSKADALLEFSHLKVDFH